MSLIGTAISAATGLVGTHMRNEAQRRENELAYQRQKRDMREMNAYNSASAQVARLQAAGLNPNMMYGQSSEGAAGTQADIPRYEPADVQNASSPLGSLGSEMIQSMIGLKDLENKTAETAASIALKDMQSYEAFTKGEMNTAEKESILLHNGLFEQTAPFELAKIMWQAENEKITHEKIQTDIDTLKKSWELTDAQIAKLAADTKLSEVQATEILTLLEPHRQEILKHIELMHSQGLLNLANMQLAFANSDYLRAKTWEVGQRYFLDEWKSQQDVLQRGAELANDSTRIQLEEKELNRKKWDLGIDSFFKVSDFVVKLIPLLLTKSPAPIGF